MTKEDYIKYWVETASKDWTATQTMFKGRVYVHALFWTHLVLEKLCKAHWIKSHQSNHPPKIHNLLYLIDSTPLKINLEQRAFLEKMNVFQLEGRYPDYKNTLYKSCNKKFTQEIITQAKDIRLWLLNSL